MYWPDTQTGVDVEPARKPVASAVRKFFTEGGLGQAPTVPGGDWFNQITNELLNVLAAAGIDPSKTDDDQLLQAIQITSQSISAREALRRSYAAAGYDLKESFENGFTITSATQALLYFADGKGYSWGGALPKTVPEGSSPATTGGIGPTAWIDVSGVLLLRVGKSNETTVIGKGALPDENSVRLSVAVGFRALASQTEGTSNTAIGNRAMEKTNGESSANNVAVGRYAMQENLTGFDNVAVGSSALENNITGKANTAVGRNAMLDNITGVDNVAIGEGCMPRIKAAASNTAVGVNACQYTDEDGTGVADTNSGFGAGAMRFNRLGKNNVAVGSAAMEGYKQGNLAVFTASISGGSVVSVTVVQGGDGYTSAPAVNSAGGGGSGATYTPTMADDGTGAGTLKVASVAVTNGGTGYTSAPTVSTAGGGLGDAGRLEGGAYDGNNNVAVGNLALGRLLDGDENVGIGRNAGIGLKNGLSNVFVGNDTATKAESSNAVGIGRNALKLASSVTSCVAIGVNTASVTTAAISNVVAVGYEALKDTEASNNVALGAFAGRHVTAGTGSTFIGHNSGGAGAAVTGNNNTALGSESMSKVTTGFNNTALGRNSMSNKIDATPLEDVFNSSAVGYQATVSGSNQVQLGNASTTTYVYGTVQNRSDARDKTDVRDTKLGIDFIMGLRPVDGRWDMRDDYVEEYEVQIGIDPETAEPIFERRVRKLPKDGSKKRERLHHWFIAQDVKELCDQLGIEFGGYQDHSVNGGCDILSLGYDEFIPPAVKAIQQCWLRLDELERRLDKLDPPPASS